MQFSAPRLTLENVAAIQRCGIHSAWLNFITQIVKASGRYQAQICKSGFGIQPWYVCLKLMAVCTHHREIDQQFSVKVNSSKVIVLTGNRPHPLGDGNQKIAG